MPETSHAFGANGELSRGAALALAAYDTQLGGMEADIAGKVGLDDPRLGVVVDVSSTAGGGPWIVGTDGRARSSDPTTLPTLTTVNVDAPTSGLYAVGTDGRATLLSGPAPATDVHPTQRAWLAAKARRLTAAPRRTTKGVVAIVADDYPAATLDVFAPLMAARGMPWSWCLNSDTFTPGYAYAAFNGSKGWADVAALNPATVEVVNHGKSHQDVTDTAALYAEIIGSRDALRASTGQAVLGWAPPGCDYPEGLRYKTAPLVTDEETYLASTAGRLILGGHAWATGTQRDPADGGTITHPLDGSPRQGACRQWLDYASDAGVSVGGIGDTHIDAAIARGHGVILSLHAIYIQGGGGTQRMSTAGLTGFLDRLKAKVDAGTVEVVTLTQWHHTQITPA